MAKFCISIPDPLKERLDLYAQQHHLKISAAIQQALGAFLGVDRRGEPKRAPSPIPWEIRVALLEQYVEDIRRHDGVLRETLERLER